MRRRHGLVALLAFAPLTLVLPGRGVRAQVIEPPTAEEVEAAETAPLFSSHDLLTLVLEADFHTMRREDRRDDDSEERPAVMRWETADGTSGVQEIQLQTRGNFRLAKRNCEFPPLRINVKKKQTKNTVFEGQDKLKLVTACKLGRSYWEQYVVKEYLIYRTFNLLTDLSFRVKPARVTYVDTSGEDDTFSRFAFLIEDDSDMAVRNGGRKQDWESGQLHPLQLENHHAILLDVFQFMIGNTDWSGVEMHNMELFRPPSGPLSTVPYDFDFSGLVDARYAEPDRTLPIRDVRDRHFRGFCPGQVGRNPEAYEEVYAFFREKKEEIYRLWREEPLLAEETREDSLEYLEEFYEILEDPDRIQRQMMADCRRIAGD